MRFRGNKSLVDAKKQQQVIYQKLRKVGVVVAYTSEALEDMICVFGVSNQIT